VSETVKPGGRLFVAIYNDQGVASRAWLSIKKLYNRLPDWAKPFFTALFIPGAEAPYVVANLMQMKAPWHHWNDYYNRRGMSRMHDIVDWVGGLPFEVAKPDRIFNFFSVQRIQTGSSGHLRLQFPKLSTDFYLRSIRA